MIHPGPYYVTTCPLCPWRYEGPDVTRYAVHLQEHEMIQIEYADGRSEAIVLDLDGGVHESWQGKQGPRLTATELFYVLNKALIDHARVEAW